MKNKKNIIIAVIVIVVGLVLAMVFGKQTSGNRSTSSETDQTESYVDEDEFEIDVFESESETVKDTEKTESEAEKDTEKAGTTNKEPLDKTKTDEASNHSGTSDNQEETEKPNRAYQRTIETPIIPFDEE